MPKERLTVRKIREILRLKWELKLSNRAIARACKVSNSTVGDYLERAGKAGVGWPLPEGLSEDELYRRLFPEEAEDVSASTRPLPDWEEVRRQLARRGVTLKLLWIEYREQYPDGYGLTQYCEYYRRWSQTHATRMRQVHKGGDEMEVDYVGMSVTIINPETGEASKAPVFVAVLPASNYTYAEVQPSRELVHWIGGHVRAMTFIGGAPKIVRPDNLKTGVQSPNYYEPEINPSYQELAEHYHLAVLPARVRKPRDKAHGENGVQNVERWVLAPLRDRTFFSVAEANRAIAPLLQALNDREMEHLGKSRRQLFEELDQPALQGLPEHPFEFALWKSARVSLDYHVAFEGHYYSVPHALVHQEVNIRATEHLLAIFHHGQQVAVHPRSAALGRFSTNPEHMLANHRFVLTTDADWLQRQAGKVGPSTAQFVAALLRSRPYPQQAFRSCLGVLSLARKHPSARMELACQRSYSANLFSYRDLKAELEALAASAPDTPLPAHENVRGKTYYS